MNGYMRSCKSSFYPYFFLFAVFNDRFLYISQAKFPEFAGKVTGMLLEMEKEDLVALVNDRTALEGKAEEAMEVLEKHRQAHEEGEPAEGRQDQAER